ncbi:MAG TPA: magnesium transporter [Bacteroidales bacterium]|jgi:magnesium transporter|nr:magnesium transporter [Bacteroidales bacterium]
MAANFELTREYLDQLKDAISNEDSVVTHEMVDDLHPADIAEIYDELNIDEAKFVHLLLEGEKSADVLMELEEDVRERFLEALPGDVIAHKFIEKLDSDDAADVLNELSEEKKSEVLKSIDDTEQAGDIVDLMSYDEDSAGGLMAKELIQVNVNWDLVTCMREMRKQAAEVDEIYYVYVVDDDGILQGTVSLKRMLLVRPNAKIKNIYNNKVISVPTDMPSNDVALIMEKYDLVALPVVDLLGRLLGRITIDDVVDVIKEEAEKDYQMISGISEDVEPSDNVLLLTRARIPWLLIGLAGGILGAQVISRFEGQISEYPQMAMFIPLIAAMGGNVGVQSSSIVVQGLANKSFSLDSTWQKLTKEVSVAFLNAAIFSILIFGYNYFFTTGFALTVMVSISLFTVMMFASVFGAFIPMILNRFKADPAVATGPFITTMNDVLGIVIYMAIGRIIFNALM